MGTQSGRMRGSDDGLPVLALYMGTSVATLIDPANTFSCSPRLMEVIERLRINQQLTIADHILDTITLADDEHPVPCCVRSSTSGACDEADQNAECSFSSDSSHSSPYTSPVIELHGPIVPPLCLPRADRALAQPGKALLRRAAMGTWDMTWHQEAEARTGMLAQAQQSMGCAG